MSDYLNIYSIIKYLGYHSLNRIADINKKSEKVMRIQSSEMLFNWYVAPKLTYSHAKISTNCMRIVLTNVC